MTSLPHPPGRRQHGLRSTSADTRQGGCPGLPVLPGLVPSTSPARKKKKEESDKTATTISHRNHDSRPSSSRPLFSHSPSYTQNITCKPIINQKQPNQPAVHSPIPPQSALSPGPRATASPDMHPCAADPRTPPPHPPSPLAARSSVPQPATAPHIPSERQAPRPA